jgi:uncharacterized protein YodC (DUF2158 family)
MNIKEGDVVRFKTGSPLMLVTNTCTNSKGNLEVYCKWFTTIGEYRSEGFLDCWLEKVEER